MASVKEKQSALLEEYWLRDHPLGAFDLFGPAHLVSLALVAAMSGGLLMHGKRIPAKTRATLRSAVATLLVVNEILWHVWALLTGQYTVTRMLPLHLCSAMVWVTAAGLARGDRRLYPAIYFLGVAGAVQALITPDAGPYGFPHFRFFQTMISHAGVFLAGIYVVSVESYRPVPRTIWTMFAGLNLYALIVWFINGLVGSNYLFVSGKPETASLLDYLPDWPWYIVILEVLTVAILVALWWPFRRHNAGISDRSPDRYG